MPYRTAWYIFAVNFAPCQKREGMTEYTGKMLGTEEEVTASELHTLRKEVDVAVIGR